MPDFLEVKNLKKYFKTKAGMLHAVDDISFTIQKGETLGVVGESGCGKSTLGRTVIGLLEATEGQVLFDGQDITKLNGAQHRDLCKRMQIVFQDPFSSLDPRRSVHDLIAEPLKIFKRYKKKSDMEQEVARLMGVVGLDERFIWSYPHELDGGRRQRIGIARALALEPDFIVCDEPVSALDVSIQAQILNLLQDLQEEMGLTYIFITHDLSVVKHISNNILVMYLGRVTEKCSSDDLFETPLHPYTKGLLSAIPIPNVHLEKKTIIMEGELISPIDPDPGCRFAKRCPYAKEICFRMQPPLEEVLENHFAACHFVREINDL